MSNKKYEYTGKTINHLDITLHQIRRLSDGSIGGFIESEENLSHYGNCFVYHNAKVTDSAVVSDNARVTGDAWVTGDAIVSENTVSISFNQKYNVTITDSIIQWGCRQFMLWDLKQFKHSDCTEEWDKDVFENA